MDLVPRSLPFESAFASRERHRQAGFMVARVMGMAGLCAAAAANVAQAETFRCELDGKVSYADRPCADGGPGRIVPHAPSPSGADQAAARERTLQDRRTLAALEQAHRAQQRSDREEERRLSRLAAQHDRQVRECTKLALKAKRAHDDYDRAGPRDLERRRSASRRADDDHAALCKGRMG